ncbi:unnamed protein product [Mytilus edulis]|uniref:Uncharacterized protein n=1 Tax=Mytilus edulis TaxID=6550 RepID=A0A8S3SJ30_MYTED|nr:unnamed protein product [Mytilus edulis]
MPSSTVVVSLATPRADNKKYQTNVELVNAMLKCEYMEDDTVTLCDNGNLSRLGKPVPKFFSQGSSDDDPLETIEKDIINYYAERGHKVLCGDFNVMTGSKLDFIENDTYDPFVMDDEEYEYDIGLQKRKSCDNKVDARVKQLLLLCITLKLRILNGRMLGDSNGNFTCFKT